MKNLIGHFVTITKHRHLVIKHCKKAGVLWQGLRHDLSKYLPSEFLVGAHYYLGEKSPNEAERQEKGYSLAWMHHKGRNKHHAEYWQDIRPNGKTEPIDMPHKYLAEMICDRVAASKIYLKDKYTDKAPWEYYNSHRDENQFSMNTRLDLEFFLVGLYQNGEAATFQALTDWIKQES